MYIPQKQLQNLHNLVMPGKVVVIYGARQVGKTTLVKKYMDEINEKVLYIDGDDVTVRGYLESQSISKLRDFIGAHTLLIVDEAQSIERIGLNLKLIVDHIPGIKVIATGSSSFDLSRDIGEPLTGRKFMLRLFTLAQMEIGQIEKRHETEANLESRLIYGSYPEVVTIRDNTRREDYLRELVSSYLFKDILELEGIRHSNKLVRILQLLVHQIGREVSLNELGNQL
ncbi:MAG: AAA family ATPase, partial [Candidatus Marinimicrobia bacterium]|nr:AAA family ATPase [Candidatus Neomarinimicrobiota bacterium]